MKLPALTSGRLRWTTFGLLASLALGIGVVGMFTAVEVSSKPDFCGSCHVMTPYYESWKTSSHRTVACVECHIAPGVTAEIRKKYEALSMVTSYFTGTYGTNPWAEIDDAACLRCHERRLLAGKELFGDVLFDHSEHLSGMRRGKTLRCTSCHSQIVQGSHIAVTSSTCVLCHFKGQQSGTGTARCTLCHHIPDTVIQREGLTFRHADVERYGMDCGGCHERPAGSDGEVPRERCVTCHNDPARLEEFGNDELLHRTHVTEHKVDCLNCHLELQHVAPPRMERAVSACVTCHATGHSPQMNLYAGIGGRGVSSMPSAMFLAGIRCEGCHLDIPGHTTEVRRASDVSCMSCHGSSYRSIFLAWKREVAERTSAARRAVEGTAAALGPSPPAALADARHNLEMVERGNGIHNVDYARALLQRSHEDLNSARRDRGLPLLAAPWKDVPFRSPCLQCHQGIERQSGEIFGRRFAHEPHVLRAGLDCAACHRPHEERARDEIVRFDHAACASCHHRSPEQRCATCHEGVTSLPPIKTWLGGFVHAFHIEQADQTCNDCHELAVGRPVRLKKEHCADCHT